MVFSYAGTGSISPVVGFDFGSISYSYTPASTLPFVVVDLGPSLLSTPTTIVDHGSITDSQAGQEDWGDLYYDKQTRFPFGAVRLASSTTFRVKKIFVGSGQLFELGEAFTRLQAPWIVEGTITLTGQANAAFLYRYNTEGLKTLRGAANGAYTTQYYGSGSLVSGSFAGEATTTLYPTDQEEQRKILFGVYGDALVLASLRHIGSGRLFNFGNITTTRTFGYHGSGVLFGFGSESRRLTYSYPGTDFFTYEDYGSIASATTEPNIDCGLIFREDDDDRYEIFDRGEILVNYTKYPHGLFKLRSETSYAKISTYSGSGDFYVLGDARGKGPQNHYGEGDIFINGNSTENFNTSFKGSGTLPIIVGSSESSTKIQQGSTVLFDIDGSVSISRTREGFNEGCEFKLHGDVFSRFIPKYSGNGIVDNTGEAFITTTNAWNGDGILFDFIGAKEAKVYSYNNSSIDFITYPDYGYVSQTATSYEDFGSLDLRYTGETGWMSTPDTRLDWQYILDNYTNYPFGLFERIKGEAHASKSYDYVASGPLFVFTGEVELRFPPFHAGDTEIIVYGTVIEKRSNTYIGFESLQISGEKAESFTPAPEIGSGSIFTINGISESFGANPPDITTDIIISGGSTEVRTRGYQGSGSIFTINGLSESVTTDEVFFTLFDLNGFASESRTRGYEGTGSIFTINGLSESVSADEVFFTLFNITGASEEVRTRGYQGSGSIFTINGLSESVTTDEVFFTLFDITGVSTQSRTRAYQGSGSIFTINGISESFGANPPDITTDIIISGAVFESRTRGYQGSGSIFTINGLSESVATDEVFFTLFNITGDSTQTRTRGYQGSGSIFTINGLSESFGANPPDITTDIIISGAVFESRTRGYEGSSRLEIFSTDVIEKVAFDYVGSGNITTLSGGAVITTQAFNSDRIILSFNGTSIEKFVANPPDITTNINIFGSGSARVRPEWIGSGILYIDAEHVERVSFAHYGSGDLFTLSSPRESVVYSYNNSSIDFITYPDFGYVSDVHSESYDYGTLDLRYTGETGWMSTPDARLDWQYILDNYTNYPFGLFERIKGDSHNSISAAHYTEGFVGIISGEAIAAFSTQYYGSGNLSIFGAATSEKKTASERFDVLFDITGGIFTEKFIAAEQLFGRIGIFGEVGVSFTGNTVQDATIFISGFSSEVRTRGYAGTGIFSTLSGAAESVTGDPPERQILFDITGQSTLQAVKAYEGFGTLFGLSGAVESSTRDEVFTSLITINGEVAINIARGYEGSGFVSSLSGSAESFTASPDNLFGLFDLGGGLVSIKSTVAEIGFGTLVEITGEIADPLLTFAEQPQVQVRIFGSAKEAYVPNWNGRGRISTLSGAAESFSVRIPAFQADLTLSGFATQSFSFGNYTADSSARIFGEIPLPPTLIFAESGTGLVSVFGDSTSKLLVNNTGFGNIFSRGIGGESLTKRIPAFQTDITLSGFGSESTTFNPPDITTHLEIFGDVSTPIRTFSEVFQVELFVSGESNVRRTNAFEGSGTLFTVGFGGEAITRRLPSFQVDMYLSGFATQKATFREVFSGSLFTFRGSSTPELLTFAEQPEVNIQVSGIAKTNFSVVNIGDGRISTLSGAAESVTVNPTEREILFSIGGGFSDIKIVKAETKQIEIEIDVVTDTRFIPNWIVEGTIPVTGVAHTTRSVVYTGEGFITTLSGAAESFTYNPTEDIALFTFFGTASIRSAVSEVKTVHTSIFAEDVQVYLVKSYQASGLVSLVGEKEESTSKVFEGTGSISTLSGAAESSAISLDNLFVLFDISGVASTKPIKVYTKIGSGSLFTRFGAGEARTISVPVNVPSQESKGLFKLEGEKQESFTVPFTGSGFLFGLVSKEERRTFAYQTEVSLTISGIASTPRTRQFFGSGSIFSFVESQSAVAFIPSTNTVLFDITGESVFRTTQSHEGTGSLFTSITSGESRTFKLSQRLVPNLVFKGAATIKNSYFYHGQANISVSGSAQESFTQSVYEGNLLIKTSGEAEQRFVITETSQGGTLEITGSASVLITSAFDTYTLFDISGTASVANSTVFSGSGTIFTFVSAKEVQPDRLYEGSGTFALVGESVDRKVNVAPQRTYGWII